MRTMRTANFAVVCFLLAITVVVASLVMAPAIVMELRPTSTPTPVLYGGFAQEECRGAWLEGWVPNVMTAEDTVDIIINREWPPDSIGHVVKACVMGGWSEWRGRFPGWGDPIGQEG